MFFYGLNDVPNRFFLIKGGQRQGYGKILFFLQGYQIIDIRIFIGVICIFCKPLIDQNGYRRLPNRLALDGVLYGTLGFNRQHAHFTLVQDHFSHRTNRYRVAFRSGCCSHNNQVVILCLFHNSLGWIIGCLLLWHYLRNIFQDAIDPMISKITKISILSRRQVKCSNFSLIISVDCQRYAQR